MVAMVGTLYAHPPLYVRSVQTYTYVQRVHDLKLPRSMLFDFMITMDQRTSTRIDDPDGLPQVDYVQGKVDQESTQK